jgi:hypothetical protein
LEYLCLIFCISVIINICYSLGLSPRDAPYQDNLELLDRSGDPRKETATCSTPVTSFSGSAESNSCSERAASLRRHGPSSRRLHARRFTIQPHEHLADRHQQLAVSSAALAGTSSDSRPLGGRRIGCCSCGAVQPWPRYASRSQSQTTLEVEYADDGTC